MRYLLLPILVLGCAGCAGSGTHSAVTATGRSGYEFRCGGVLGSSMDCAVEATRYCPNGYVPVFESPTRLVATCAAAEGSGVVAGAPAQSPVTQSAGMTQVAPAPIAPASVAAATPIETSAYAGASGTASSLVSPVRASPQPGAVDGQAGPLTNEEKEALFRNFDAYLASQPGRRGRAH